MRLGRSTSVSGVKLLPSVSSWIPLDGLLLAQIHIYVLEDITKWLKIYTKTDSRFQKLHEEFGQRQKSSGNPQKLNFKKYIHSAKALYKEGLCTLLSTTCSLSHFSQHNSSIFFQLKFYILSTNIAHQSANVPHIIYETTYNFSFKASINIQYNDA